MSAHKNSVYRKISEEIAAQIASGTLAVGEQLEPERRLMERFGVERTTVRRALEVLESQGLIVKKTGLGSFVADGTEKTASARAEVPLQTNPQTEPKKKAASRTQTSVRRKDLPPQLTVEADCAAAARLICHHLTGLGHKMIAFVGCESAHFTAFAGENAREGRYSSERFVLTESPYDAADAFERMWRAQRTKPTALVTSSVGEAKEIAARAERLGVRIPNELSLAVMQTQPDSDFTGCIFDLAALRARLVTLVCDLTDGQIPSFAAVAAPQMHEGSSAALAPSDASRSRGGMSDYLL